MDKDKSTLACVGQTCAPAIPTADSLCPGCPTPRLAGPDYFLISGEQSPRCPFTPLPLTLQESLP